MRDSQRAAACRAEDALWRQRGNGLVAERIARSMIEDACDSLDVDAPDLSFPGSPDAQLSLARGELVVPPWAIRPVQLSHMVAHHATDRLFPPHGVEFASSWLSVLRDWDPRLAYALEQELDRERVRHDPDVQARDVRRRLVDLVNHRRGEIVVVTLADPPEEVCGEIEGRPGLADGNVSVGGRVIPLSRVRYQSASRRPAAKPRKRGRSR